MITNIRLDLSEHQLNTLACKLAGKVVKRNATRKEVVDFVERLVTDQLGGHYTAPEAPDKPQAPLGTSYPGLGRVSSWEAAEISQLQAQGKSKGYIAGWIRVGRSLGK